MSFFALLDLLQNGPPLPWRAGVLPRKEFCEAVTRIHNYNRFKHGAYALRLNDELTNLAQQWADTLSKEKELSHHNFKFKGTRIGQNIAMKWAPNRATYDPEELCDQWYRENQDFDFGAEPAELKAGHFTQMVWKNSTEIGVGRSQAKDGRSIVVVNYFPPGNVIGEFNANVLPLCLTPSSTTVRAISSKRSSIKPSKVNLASRSSKARPSASSQLSQGLNRWSRPSMVSQMSSNLLGTELGQEPV